jgi:hypothetical protein
LGPRAAAGTRRIGFFGACDPSQVDEVVGFRASDFNPDLLAGLFFYSASENNQFEGFAAAAHALRQQVFAHHRESYSVQDILNEVNNRGPGGNVAPQEQIHEMVVGAIQRKVVNRRRHYRWLDTVGEPIQPGAGQRQRFAGGRLDRDGRRVGALSLRDLVAPGSIIVVDYRDMDEGSYAAIVSIFLKEAQRLRKRGQGAGVVQLIDEAHRIFDNESRHSATLSGSFERVMREGRSVDHSVVMSLQNASQIPPRVMNNLNTKIVMRQNSKAEADAATQTMGKEFAAQAMRLGTGHALVSMHESRAIVLAQMAPSPYELMRSDLDGAAQVRAVAADEEFPD